MSNKKAFLSYFRGLANANTDIDAAQNKTFFQGSIEEILLAIQENRLKPNHWCMAMEPPERKFMDMNSDNIQKIWLAAFHIFKNSDFTGNNFTADQDILSDAEDIADQLLMRILFDRYYAENPVPTALQIKHFDISTAEYMEINKTMYLGRIGIRCELSFSAKMSELNPLKFNDL